MDEIIKKDLWRYEGIKCHSKFVQLRYFLFTPGFRYTCFFRKAQQCGLLKWFWVSCLKLCSYRYHYQIPYQTKIGEGLYIGHYGTILVNPEAIIGKNFHIAPGALIGRSSGKGKCGAPVIGDNVVVCGNSIILGSIKIGDNVLIAPGAFCNFDVPPNSIVIGNPGKIISKKTSPTEKFNIFPVQKYR